LVGVGFPRTVDGAVGVGQPGAAVPVPSLHIEGSVDKQKIVSELLEVPLSFLLIARVGGVLDLSFGLADLSREYFDCPEDGVDEVSEGDGAIIVFGGLLEYLD